MNNFTKCVLGLLGTTVLNYPSPSQADPLSSPFPANDTFLGKLGAAPRATRDSLPYSDITFSTTTQQVNEGDGFAKITVERSCDGKPLPMEFMSYQIVNSDDYKAKQGVDYREVYGTLQWNENECGMKEFQVPIIDDVEPEFDESFRVAAVNVQNTTILSGTDSSAGTLITIVDNDADYAAKTNVLSFAQQNYQLDEGKETYVMIERGQCEPYSPAGTVDVIITPKEREFDYRLFGSSMVGTKGNVFTLRWNEVHSRSDCSPLNVYMGGMQDTLIEPTETVELTLANPSTGATLGQNHSTIDILDDDSSTIGFAQTNYNVTNSDYIDITIERKNCTGEVPAATTTFSGDGMYGNLPKLIWQQNECGSKKVSLKTSKTSQRTYGNLIDVSGATTDLVIVNALGTSAFSGTKIGFSQSYYNTLENSVMATIDIERTGCEKDVPAPAAEVQYYYYGITAEKPLDYLDYAERSGNLSWEANECGVNSFTVPIIQDSSSESNESLSLYLSSVTGVMIDSSRSFATLTIIDDDPSPEDKFIAPKSTTLTLPLNTSSGLDLSNAKAPLTWQVSDEGIVKVDAAGNITALALGEATVTMTDAHNNSSSWQVTVVSDKFAILTFQGNPEASVGNYFDLKINSHYVVPDDKQQVDLWVGIHITGMPDDQLLYVTDSSYISSLLSATPQPFKRGLQRIDNTYPILHFVVTPDMVGEYTLYAMLTESGKTPFEDAAQRSILATQIIKLH